MHFTSILKCLLSVFSVQIVLLTAHFIINPDIFDGLFLHGEMVFSCYTGISHPTEFRTKVVSLHCLNAKFRVRDDKVNVSF